MNCPRGWHLGPLRVLSHRVVCMACTKVVDPASGDLERHQRLSVAVSQLKLSVWGSIALREIKQARLPPPQ
jgi:hypothetical protein